MGQQGEPGQTVETEPRNEFPSRLKSRFSQAEQKLRQVLASLVSLREVSNEHFSQFPAQVSLYS